MNSKKLKRKMFLIFLLTVFLLSGQINTFANEKWTQIRSENFLMVGSADEDELRRVALKLEQFRHAFTQIFPKLNFKSPIPTNVVVFKDDKSFSNFKPIEDGKKRDWVAGYFQPNDDVNYIVISTEAEQEQTYKIIFHEYVHFLINNNFGKSNVPPWLNEGFAEYFEQMKIKDGKITLGGLNMNHLGLLSRTQFIPFETFFEIDYYSLNRQTNDGVGLFYAQAWILMHYLNHSNKGKGQGDQLTEFMDMILAGKPPKESFEKAFQTGYKIMEFNLRNYVKQTRFKTLSFSSKADLDFETKMDVSPLDDAEAKAFQGDLLYRSNRFEEASAYLDEAIKINPKSAFANTTLGLVRMKQKNFPEAKMFLEKALKLNPDNYLVHYNYAYVLSRERINEGGLVSSFDPETGEKMKTSIRRAIALNPGFAESYNLFAFISIIQNSEIDEAIEMLNKALQIAPGNQWYLMRISELYLRKEDFDNARKIARKVFDSAADNNLRNYAQNTLKSIDSYRAQLERIKNRDNSAKGSPNTIIMRTDKPLTEEEIAALQREFMNKSINEALRKPQNGEQRLTGFITQIKCGRRGVTFFVKTENETLQLSGKDFQGMHLAAFNVDLEGKQFGCDTTFPDNLAVVTYLPNSNSKTRLDGKIVAVEIVPKNFTFVEIEN